MSERLFKSIVVLGAALTGGCGGMVSRPTGDPSPENGGSDTVAASTGGAGAASGGSSIVVSAAGGAVARGSGGSPQAGLLALDCPTQQVVCECDNANGFLEPCTPGTATGQAIHCNCDKTAPLVPADCPSTTQFTCIDWSAAGTSCSCDATAPFSSAVCDPGYVYMCHSYGPDVGCRCVCCMIR
ncbi:MAG TPA: hypothetical protein VHU80_02815 [Polyangiaceae bacterium]|jgi:hypothetical protein|nr:hypothetical protein [Polyangiaceae bacterium]